MSMQAMAWETSDHIRTPDGDMIERSTEIGKLNKLQYVKYTGTEFEKFGGRWETVTYYVYKSPNYPEVYRIKVINGRVADIEWTR